VLFFKKPVILQSLPEQHVSLSLALLTVFLFGYAGCPMVRLAELRCSPIWREKSGSQKLWYDAASQERMPQ
jgi:hypothetical protein